MKEGGRRMGLSERGMGNAVNDRERRENGSEGWRNKEERE